MSERSLDRSGAGFKDEIEGSLAGAPEACETTRDGNRSQTSLSRLSSEAERHLLRERSRRADQSRRAVEGSSPGIQVVFELIVRERLDYHPRAIRFQGFEDVSRRAHRIAHVVQAIEESDEVVIGAGILLGSSNLEAYTVRNARMFGGTLCVINRAFVIVEPKEFRLGKRRGHQDSRSAVSTSDVGYACAGFEFLLNAIE